MSKQITLIGEILIDTIKSVKIIIEQTEKSKPFIYTKNGDGKTATLIEAVNRVKETDKRPFGDGYRYFLNSCNFEQAQAVLKMTDIPFLRYKVELIREGLTQ